MASKEITANVFLKVWKTRIYFVNKEELELFRRVFYECLRIQALLAPNVLKKMEKIFNNSMSPKERESLHFLNFSKNKILTKFKMVSPRWKKQKLPLSLVNVLTPKEIATIPSKTLQDFFYELYEVFFEGQKGRAKKAYGIKKDSTKIKERADKFQKCHGHSYKTHGKVKKYGLEYESLKLNISSKFNKQWQESKNFKSLKIPKMSLGDGKVSKIYLKKLPKKTF